MSPRPSFASGGSAVLVEIADSAEVVLDARATRRLVALELGEIEVPPPLHAGRDRVPLFFRVAQDGDNLRVELWQRGEYYGARVVSGSNAAGQLAARRVALAAAELARRLQKKRQLQTERERSVEAARAAGRERDARRVLDGPFALRPSLEFAHIGGTSNGLWGTRLLAQSTFSHRVRLDTGLALLGGSGVSSAKLEWLELSVAPMHRVTLSEAIDLDLGVEAAAAWLHVSHVNGVDAIPDEYETWSARAAAVARIEPRLSRHVRFSAGASAGLLLRAIPIEPLSGTHDRIRGLWLGVNLGVVLTP